MNDNVNNKNNMNNYPFSNYGNGENNNLTNNQINDNLIEGTNLTQINNNGVPNSIQSNSNDLVIPPIFPNNPPTQSMNQNLNVDSTSNNFNTTPNGNTNMINDVTTGLGTISGNNNTVPNSIQSNSNDLVIPPIFPNDPPTQSMNQNLNVDSTSNNFNTTPNGNTNMINDVTTGLGTISGNNNTVPNSIQSNSNDLVIPPIFPNDPPTQSMNQNLNVDSTSNNFNTTPNGNTNMINDVTTGLGTISSTNNAVPNSTQDSSSPQTIQTTQVNLNENQMKNGSNVNSNNINDDELLKSFIGKNYEKITTRPFNLAGFFLGTCYMLYRKMFLYGLLLFILTFIISTFVNNFLITIGFNVVVGVLVNKIYIHYAKSKINKIKIKHSQSSFDELKSVCSKKGGTSIGMVFLGLGLQTVIIIVVALIMLLSGIATGITSIFSFLTSQSQIGDVTDDSIEDNKVFDGAFLYNTSVILEDEFEFSIPSQFNKEGFFNSESHFDYEYESGLGIFDSCSISLAQVDGWNSAENLVEQMAVYYNNSILEQVTTKLVNDINWYSFATGSSSDAKYYYSMNKNNKVFLLEFEKEEDASSDCFSHKDEILNSIKIK